MLAFLIVCAVLCALVLTLTIISIVATPRATRLFPAVANTRADRQPPESVELQQSPSPTASKPPRNRLVEDARVLEEIEERFNDNKESLKKYYSTAENIKRAQSDIILLSVLKNAYEKGDSQQARTVGRKAATLLSEVQQQRRVMYASLLEEVFIKQGMDAQVTATGKNKEQLRISYALMSRPLMYKLENSSNIKEQAGALGFSKLIYTNGFESQLGRTWTIDL